MDLKYLAILPEAVLALTVLVLLVADAFSERKRPLSYIALAGVVGALVAVWPTLNETAPALWGNQVTLDAFTKFFKILFLSIAGLVILASVNFVERRQMALGEYNVFVLLVTLGMMFMAGSRDLLTIYLGLELASISSYIMAGMLRRDPKSNEAAIKYFLTGAFASATLLFGLSLLYGLTGSTQLSAIAGALGSGGMFGASPATVWAAAVFVMAGFGFKIAAVPFHFWAPDAYEGAPTPVTMFFTVGPKAAAMAALLRVVFMGLPALEPQLMTIAAWAALVTMTVGNLTALWQRNIKRMMAYSSIAHVGYMLVGLAAGPDGVQGILYYTLAYAVTNLGIFAVITLLDLEGKGAAVDDYLGLVHRSPLLAWTMLIGFVSLIGIPPTAGFVGKLLLFSAAVDNGLAWLAVAMAINSAVSVGYYYGIVRNMFLGKPQTDEALPRSTGLRTTVTVGLIGTLVLGIIVNPVMQWTELAALLRLY